MKVMACCCTRRYRLVYAGGWRSWWTEAPSGARWGVPEIVNTDQDSQFTAAEFTDAVLEQGYWLSMDRRGAWRDNVFVEWLWRSVKYERVYLKAYDSVSAARADIDHDMGWYNAARAHSRLGDFAPDGHHIAKLPAQALAA
jgi:putative transposase